jgi:beta-glucosidase
MTGLTRVRVTSTTRSVKRRSAWRRPLLLGALLLTASCAKLLGLKEGSPGGSCVLNSDCAPDQVCIFRVCSAACATDRDCSGGAMCLSTANGKACATPQAASCGVDMTCPDGTVCDTDTCRTSCTGDLQCNVDQLCMNQVCQSNPDYMPSGGSGGSAGNSAGGGTSGGTNSGGSSGASLGGSSGSGGSGGSPIAACTKYTATPVTTLTPVDSRASSVVVAMPVASRIAQLNGGPLCPQYDCDFNGPASTDAGFDAFAMRSGTRGIHNIPPAAATTWPVPIARAASFDTDLEQRIGGYEATEALGFHVDLVLAPGLNVLRHPQWGRAQDTYGEDSLLVGKMAAAFIRGMQAGGVPACAHHMGAYTAENNRTTVNDTVDETLREIYARPVQIAIDEADPACIQTPYAKVNGIQSTQNTHLLTDILRTDLGFPGFVLSEWWSTLSNSGAADLNAGLDYEMPDSTAFQSLPSDLSANTVTVTTINQAVSRIFNVRYKFKQDTAAYHSRPTTGILGSSGSDLALQSALEGAVLLKNAGILPLGSAMSTSIMMIGPDQKVPSISTGTAGVASGLGDRGSENTVPPHAVSFADGLTKLGFSVSFGTDPANASSANVVIIPISMAHEDEGEGFNGGADRQDLTLSGAHPLHWGTTKAATFIAAVAAVNPNVIVLLETGGPVLMEDWMGSAKAIVQTSYPGQEGGTAVAQLLSGAKNFSGKLPYTIAKVATDYPTFGNNGTTLNIDYFHGYRKLENDGITPRFWFGYGLSYTTYAYSNLMVLCPGGVTKDGELTVSVNVKNTGTMAGDEIVQLYVSPPASAARRPKKELKVFTRVTLDPGKSAVVQLAVPASALAFWDPTTAAWVIDSGTYHVLVGPSADPAQLSSAAFTVQ